MEGRQKAHIWLKGENSPKNQKKKKRRKTSKNIKDVNFIYTGREIMVDKLIKVMSSGMTGKHSISPWLVYAIQKK